MRILTANLRPVKRIFSQVSVSGVEYNDKVLLDFENKTLSFQGPNTIVKTKLNLEDNDGKGLEHRKMFIDGGKFFSLVGFFDYIDLDENDVFYSSSGDSFRIPELKEDVDIDGGLFEDWKKFTVDFTPDFNNKLTASMSYIDTDPNSDYSALFFKKGKLIACNRFRIFLASVDNGLANAEFNIPLSILKLITTLNPEGEVELLYRTESNDAIMLELTYGDMWIRCSSSSRYVLPFDPESDDFKAMYDHPNFFVVSLEEFGNATNLISTYYTKVDETVCNMSFLTSDENNMELHLNVHYEQSGDIECKVNISSCNNPEYFDGKNTASYITFLDKAIKTMTKLGVKDALITYDEDAPAIGFFDAREEIPVNVICTITEEI